MEFPPGGVNRFFPASNSPFGNDQAPAVFFADQKNALRRWTRNTRSRVRLCERVHQKCRRSILPTGSLLTLRRRSAENLARNCEQKERLSHPLLPQAASILGVPQRRAPHPTLSFSRSGAGTRSAHGRCLLHSTQMHRQRNPGLLSHDVLFHPEGYVGCRERNTGQACRQTS